MHHRAPVRTLRNEVAVICFAWPRRRIRHGTTVLQDGSQIYSYSMDSWETTDRIIHESHAHVIREITDLPRMQQWFCTKIVATTQDSHRTSFPTENHSLDQQLEVCLRYDRHFCELGSAQMQGQPKQGRGMSETQRWQPFEMAKMVQRSI